MGGKEAILTARRMLEAGHPISLPVIAIENCSRSNERWQHITLAELALGLPACEGPVLVMMGEAMRQRPETIIATPET
jgi:uroporphyrin-III C-methyltransferase